MPEKNVSTHTFELDVCKNSKDNKFFFFFNVKNKHQTRLTDNNGYTVKHADETIINNFRNTTFPFGQGSALK